MAAAVAAFKRALTAKRASDAAAAREAEAKARRAAPLDAGVKRFQPEVSGQTQGLAGAASELEATAQSMTGIAEEIGAQVQTVAGAAEQASSIVNTVAAEELSISIRDITSSGDPGGPGPRRNPGPFSDRERPQPRRRHLPGGREGGLSGRLITTLWLRPIPF